MANQDFLITFSVDGTQAIRMMEQIGAKAVALEAKLNSLGRGAGTGGAAGGILKNLGMAPSQIAETNAQLQKMRNAVAEMYAMRTTRQSIGLPVSGPALEREALAVKTLAERLGQTSPEYRRLIDESKSLAAQSVATSKSMDDSSTAFSRHTARIVEALIVYEAFGRAIQGLQAGIGLIVDIDRESRRLEAVLNIDPEAAGGFITGLGEIAIETVTPLEDLVAEADRAAAAFLDMNDPAAQTAASLELMAEAGKFTTVTQRDLGIEISNIIAIMKQLDIPVEQLGDHLGKIVVAGGKSSTVISGLTDALQISTRAAAQAGVNFDVLLAIESRFLVETGRTGSEVGNIFKLIFQRLSDPSVAENVADITGGLLQMRDAAGAIRDPIRIMLELNALLKEGAISSTQFRDSIDAIAPPLNPAAKADFILINQLLQEIGPAVKEIGAADVSSLDALVDKINDALGPQFKKLLEEAKVAFVDLFSEDILAAGQSLIDIIRGIGGALALVNPEVLKTLTGFVTLLASLKLVSFVASRLIPVIGLGGLAGALRAMGAGMAAAAGTFSAGAGAAAALGTAFGVLKAAVIGLSSAFGPLLIALAAFMAIDFAAKIGEMQAGLKGQIGGSLVGLNREQLLQRRAEIQGELDSDQGGPINNIIGAFTVDPALNEALAEIDRQLVIIGDNGEVAGDQLAEGFSVAGDAANDAAQGAQFLANLAEHPFDAEKAAADAYAASLANMTFEQQVATESARLLEGMAGPLAEAFRDLNERVKDGAISQAEWVAGQDQVRQAAEISTNLVAAFGDQLRTLIPVLGDADAGNEALAEALFKVILLSTDGLPALQRYAGAAINMAVAARTAARDTFLAAQAQVVFNALLSGGPWGAIKALQAATAQLAILQRQIFDANQSIAKLFGNINQTLGTSGSKTFGTGGGGFTGTSGGGGVKQQTPILDIGDLPADQLAQLIAMATALRNAIPGETASSINELVAIIKDGQFLQTVKGIDDRLLRIALEELIEVEKKRLALEEAQLRQGILSNLVTNVGPLGALISQPTTFGVGGSLALGSGLNIDPNTGNFTINVPIELNGLEPAALQALIYQTISQAIQDALATGGA